MKNKRFIYFFLLLVSLIMVTAPALPHHHHGDGIICMKDDISEKECCPATHNHHHQSDDPCCNDYCTAHFQTVTPDIQIDELQPEFQYSVILFTGQLLLSLHKPGENTINPDYVYRESLHGTYIQRATGLRAPPYLLS